MKIYQGTFLIWEYKSGLGNKYSTWLVRSSFKHVGKRNIHTGNLGLPISDKNLCIYVYIFMSSHYIPLFDPGPTLDASLDL